MPGESVCVAGTKGASIYGLQRQPPPTFSSCVWSAGPRAGGAKGYSASSWARRSWAGGEETSWAAGWRGNRGQCIRGLERL